MTRAVASLGLEERRLRGRLCGLWACGLQFDPQARDHLPDDAGSSLTWLS